MLDKKKRYEKILKFTSDYISKKGYSPTLSEIAKKAGISVSSTYRYVKTLEAAGLIDSGGGKKRKITIKSENVKGKAISVPVFSEIVSTNGTNFPKENILFYIWLPASRFGEGEYFATELYEKQFIPLGCQEGDYIIFKKTSKARNGDIAMIKLEKAATIAMIKYLADGFQLTLENGKTKIQKEAEILGRAIAMQRLNI